MAQRPSFSGEPIEQLLAVARLHLDDARKAALGPTMDQMYGLIDLLDGVDLAEVPPATAFDARWE